MNTFVTQYEIAFQLSESARLAPAVCRYVADTRHITNMPVFSLLAGLASPTPLHRNAMRSSGDEQTKGASCAP